MLSFSCINIVISFFALFNSFFFVYNKSNIIGLKLEEILNMKSYLIVFLISMVPLIELRGAIPYAVGSGVHYRHYRKHASSTFYLFLRPQGSGVGQG